MKNLRIFITVLLVFAFALPLLAACGPKNVQTDSGSTTGTNPPAVTEPPKDEYVISADKVKDMKIVYSNEADNNIISAATALKNAIKSKLGVDIPVTSDYLRENSDVYIEYEYEILIGDTSREASGNVFTKLRTNDFAYTVLGTKIVIKGGDSDSTVAAVNDFAYDLVLMRDKNDPTFFTSGLEVLNNAAYTLESLTINGTDISDFSIVYSNAETSKPLAIYLKEQICLLTGYNLTIKTDTATYSGAYEIAIGDTNRAQNPANDMVSGKMGIKTSGKIVAVYGKDIHGHAKAAEWLLGMFTGQAQNKECKLSLPEKTVSDIGGELSVMSFNVQIGFITTERINRLKLMISKYLPDILGVQEAGDKWMNELKSEYSAYYDYVGLGREAGDKGERTAIFYAKDRFEVLESGTKWLTDTPDTPGSMYPGAEYLRIFTWAVFKDKVTGDEFLFINTHLDTSSNMVRTAEVRYILNFIADYKDLAVVITGDMNTYANSPALLMLEDAGFASSSDLTTNKNTDPNIDWIFVTGDCIGASEFKVLNERILGDYPSDHSPVYSKITVKYPEGGVNRDWEKEEILPQTPEGYLDIKSDPEKEFGQPHRIH